MGKVVASTIPGFHAGFRSLPMSRKDQQKRKEREVRKKEEKKLADELERKRKAAKRDIPDILEQLEVLFQANAGRALKMAFQDRASSDEIATALGVPQGHVDYLFDVASHVSDDLLRIIQRWPAAFDNRAVLENALTAVRSGAHRQLFRF
jgi:hypothetical protein